MGSRFVDLQDDWRGAGTEARVLIIDDDPAPLAGQIGESFPACRLKVVRTTTSALDSILSDAPDIIFLDPQLPNENGSELYDEIRRAAPLTPVLFIASSGTADGAIQAIKQGAFDYIFKPLEKGQFERVVRAAIESSRQKRGDAIGATITPVSPRDGGLSGTCQAMREVYKSIGVVAGQDVNVIVTGESGTGKELVARAIVRHSSRSAEPFLAINCAAIPENLLESELFGHEKGAFSGADRRRIGKFEQCNGGTILLDEIGDMPIALQAKILRLLQDQTFERVGGNETIKTDVRLIASTHRDLKTWAAEGKFRADLYYRLSVFTIHLPPLRERGRDLPVLIQHLLKQYSHELGKEGCEIGCDAMESLQQYHWPGNVRELQSVLKQALLRSRGRIVLPAFLSTPPDAAQSTSPGMPPSSSGFDVEMFLEQRLSPDAKNLYADLHRELDRHSLARVMTYTHGNRHMASRVLGIARQTLRLKLRESGLHIPQPIEAEDESGEVPPITGQIVQVG